jgi:two-component system, NarL family, captular synthesis response regulator RcsB
MCKEQDMSLRIIIADDHPLVLVGGRIAIERGGERIVGLAKNADELVYQLKETSCDVVITDFLMPSENQGDGLALIDYISREYPSMAIIVLTMLSRPTALQSMLLKGARGLVDKRAPMDELPIAARIVASGQIYMSPGIAAVLKELGEPPEEIADPTLSRREASVIEKYVSGLSLGEIAKQDGLSVKTISRQKRDAMRKLGICHDSLLGDYVRENGLSRMAPGARRRRKVEESA